MRQLSFILIFLSCSFIGFGKEEIPRELIPEIMLESSKKDKSLSKKEAVYEFQFEDLFYRTKEHTLLYSIDGKTLKARLGVQNKLEVKTTPGKHVFQFFYSERYFEIYTDSLLIQPQYRNEYSVRFTDAVEPVMVEKPVIYLYPPDEMDITVTVKPAGEMIFTYPITEDSWTVTAKPNGDITMNGETYNYLFWESQQPSLSYDWSEGYAVERKNITAFLEESLNTFGLTSKEQADFITYWAPQMMRSKGCVLQFMLNDECAKYADLTVSPKPDKVFRIYMVWSPVENIADFNYLRPQNIQKINRLGFTVLEWGGVEIDPQQLPIKKQTL